MRPIEFRGLSINGDWYYGLLSISQGLGGQPEKGYYISNKVGMPWAYQVRPETVGQFTGLLDKNGKKIWEGDILIKRSTEVLNGSDDLKWVVRFTCSDYNAFFDFGYMSRPDRCEVIGNI